MADWGDYTPGRWYVVGAPWGDGTDVIAGSPDPHIGIFVASVDATFFAEPEDSNPHALADARLIAKAYLIPRLEAALEMLARDHPAWTAEGPDESRAVLVDALLAELRSEP